MGKPDKKEKKEKAEEDIFQPPRITRDPQSRSVCIGDRADLRVNAIGIPKPNYQWLLNGQKVPGANGPMLLIPRLQRNNAGQYVCEVSNKAGTVTSRMATISIKEKKDEKLGLVCEPENPELGAPFRILLSQEVEGDVQWYFNENPIKGACGVEFRLSEFKAKYEGSYYATITSGGKYLTTEPVVVKAASPQAAVPPPIPAAAPTPPPIPSSTATTISLLDTLETNENSVFTPPPVEEPQAETFEEFIPEPKEMAVEEAEEEDDSFFAFEPAVIEDEAEEEIAEERPPSLRLIKLQTMLQKFSAYRPRREEAFSPTQTFSANESSDWHEFVQELRKRIA